MFRTALRTSAGVAFRQRSVARRYASSHSKQPAGDATWAMGSAAVFGSITAYLLLSGGSPAEAALHSTSHMKIADATEKDVAPEDAPTLVNTAAESKHKGSGRQITSIEGAKSDDSDDSEDKEESSSSSASSSSESKEESSPDATTEPEEGRKAEDIPESEIAKVAKDSLKKAESIAVPRVAMGNDEGSSKSDESSSSSSSSEGGKMKAADEGRYAEDIPQAELSQSLHQAEEACVPKATWAHGEKAE